MAHNTKTIPLDQAYAPTCIGRNGTMWTKAIEVQTIDGVKINGKTGERISGMWAAIWPVNSKGQTGNAGFYGISPADARNLATALIEFADEGEAARWQLPEELRAGSDNGDFEAEGCDAEGTYKLYPLEHYGRKYMNRYVEEPDEVLLEKFHVFGDGDDDFVDDHNVAMQRFAEYVNTYGCARVYFDVDNDGDTEFEDCLLSYGSFPA